MDGNVAGPPGVPSIVGAPVAPPAGLAVVPPPEVVPTPAPAPGPNLNDAKFFINRELS